MSNEAASRGNLKSPLEESSFFKLTLFEQLEYFRGCLNNRPISMCGKGTDGTAIIKSRIKDHSCSYAGSFHLPCFIYSGRKGVPSQECGRSIGKRIKPPFVNAFGKAIGIHCRGRSFKIRVISVEQLVPKPRTRLEGSQSFDMLSKQVQYFRSIRVIFRQHVKKFCFGEDCPTVSSCPMKLRMFGHAFRPSVHINAFFDVKHFA